MVCAAPYLSVLSMTNVSSQLLRQFHRDDQPAPAHWGDWTAASCCMPRQNCVERDSWVQARDSKSGLQFANIYGIQVALGNANFFEERFRTCAKLLPAHLEVCP